MDQAKTDEMLRWDKQTLSRAVQFITGFNNMRNCTGRKTGMTRTCRLCGQSDEKGSHLAWECQETKGIHIGKEWDPQSLRDFLTNDRIKYLMDKR